MKNQNGESVEKIFEEVAMQGVAAVAPGSAARCPKCNGVGYHVRVRHFDDEDADVWECQSPLCTAFGLYWHTPREKDECGKLRCALIALVKAEEASIDQFTAKEIDALERALDRANRVLYPERYSSPNVKDEPRAERVGSNVCSPLFFL